MAVWNLLMDLIPFEWASHGFMRSALLAVLVISPLFGLLSTMVVSNRMSFFSDALGHSAFTGIAIGVLCGFADPMWIAVVFAVVFALLFTLVRQMIVTHTGALDTLLGVAAVAAVFAVRKFLCTREDQPDAPNRVLSQ